MEWVFRYAVPVGTIVMFHGNYNNIPKGWHICDGNAGTPNLIDRFIVGAKSPTSGEYAVNTTGGSKEVTL